MGFILAALFVLLLLILVGFIAMYNGLVRARQLTSNAWAQIDVQLKRRYDLIPNLVEAVKGIMAHEKETLENVIKARNQAVQATGVSDKAKAEGQLTAALTGFFGLMEAYPQLRANENMASLQEELQGTESKISFARQYYNDVVTSYNTKIEVFPSSIVAGMGNFKPKELFEIDDAKEREPVQIQF
ncbi:LemA family protein [Kamptonema cortianum]|nr:LemA family protein [Geitlerinema splendidum]MDK3155947.1 LemA family protein [Kamptonema cortianum]